MFHLPRLNNQPYRLAILTDKPTEEDLLNGKLFSGQSGKLLWSIASQCGMVADACLIGSVDDPSTMQQVELWKPNLILLLGDEPLRAAKGHYVPFTLDEEDFESEVDDYIADLDDEKTTKKKTPIDKWRGSLFLGFSSRFKCLATYHPRTIFAAYGEQIYPFSLDLQRARKEASSPTLELPSRSLLVEETPDRVLEMLDHLLLSKPLVACDIEGYIHTMSCISFATSASEAFIVPTSGNFWGDLEWKMWQKLALVLEDPSIPKILQNCLYDLFVLQYSYSIRVRGVIDDTMLKHWELLCELPKSLGFQTSIYTTEPYYKSERQSTDRLNFFRYCCKDSAVTFEINSLLERKLTPKQKAHYHFNLSLVDPILYMENKGMAYNSPLAETRLAEIERKIARLQWTLNYIYEGPQELSRQEWIAKCADSFCYKKELSLISDATSILHHCKPSELSSAQRAVTILQQETPLTLSDVGELQILVGAGLNVKSTTQLCSFLYEDLALPKVFKKEKGRLTDRLTTDSLALLKLYGKTSDASIKLILTIRSLRTRCNNLRAQTDCDGRIRCGYNIVGTETGRLSCYKSPTGSGFNLQTVTKKDRDLFVADPGYFFFQCDLSGADGWTVAAHCKALGDSTMWDDYMFGLKPARIIVLLRHFGKQVNSWPREKIKAESKNIDDEGWEYFSGKQTQHGGFYGMTENVMSDTIARASYKIYGEPLFVSPQECRTNLDLMFSRYPGGPLWHRSSGNKLIQLGFLETSIGHVRKFFGRRKEGSSPNRETLKQWLASEPQFMTTYVTKLALHKLWTDKENRFYSTDTSSGQQTIGNTQRCSLRIQPLHTVHDSLNGQWRKEESEWAKAKVRSYFNNPVTVAGQTLVIPFEGSFGTSWGSLKEGKI